MDSTTNQTEQKKYKAMKKQDLYDLLNDFNTNRVAETVWQVLMEQRNITLEQAKNEQVVKGSEVALVVEQWT